MIIAVNNKDEKYKRMPVADCVISSPSPFANNAATPCGNIKKIKYTIIAKADAKQIHTFNASLTRSRLPAPKFADMIGWIPCAKPFNRPLQT